jgi:hypothetical protein
MTVRTMPAPSAATSASRRTSRSFADPAFLIAAGLYIAVAIAEAVFIARALPSLLDTSLPDIGSFYVVVP